MDAHLRPLLLPSSLLTSLFLVGACAVDDVDPDLTASTHPITELGIGAAIEKISAVRAAVDRGDEGKGTLSVAGPEWRDEFGAAVHGIEHRIPPKGDAVLPAGGKRTYWIDPKTKLPTLILTHDEKGREVEYYHYDRLQFDVRLDDDDFDPDRLWGAADAAKKEQR